MFRSAQFKANILVACVVQRICIILYNVLQIEIGTTLLDCIATRIAQRRKEAVPSYRNNEIHGGTFGPAKVCAAVRLYQFFLAMHQVRIDHFHMVQIANTRIRRFGILLANAIQVHRNVFATVLGRSHDNAIIHCLALLITLILLNDIHELQRRECTLGTTLYRIQHHEDMAIATPRNIFTVLYLRSLSRALVSIHD